MFLFFVLFFCLFVVVFFFQCSGGVGFGRGFVCSPFCLWIKIHSKEKENSGFNEFYVCKCQVNNLEKSKKQPVEGWTEPVPWVRGLVAERTEHTFFRLANNLDGFVDVWAVRQVLCSLGEKGSLVMNI